MDLSPKLKFRKLYVEEGISHTTENLKQIIEWMPKVGYNTLVIPTDYQGHGRVKWDNWREALRPELQKRGITIEVGGHGYQNFIAADMEEPKLFERHPEWFGADQKGARHRERAWVFCTSNADAVEYLTKNVVAYLKARPEIQIFDFWPPDGARWCECENCRKLGSASDRQAILAHHVREALRVARPEVRLEVLAYHTSIVSPERANLDKEILLDFCPIAQQFEKQISDPTSEANSTYAASLKSWRAAFSGDISVYSYYRKYAWNSLPVTIPHYMQKDLQFYATFPVQGVSTYAEPGDWFTYELNHYVLAALAWDPDSDVDALIAKFCDARYGVASAPVRQALSTVEGIVRSYCNIPGTSLKSAREISDAQARLTQCTDELERAIQSSPGKSVSRNISRLRLMCDYAASDLAIQKMRAEKADPAAIRQAVVTLHDFLDKHGDEGVFLLGRLSKRNMLTNYGVRDNN